MVASGVRTTRPFRTGVQGPNHSATAPTVLGGVLILVLVLVPPALASNVHYSKLVTNLFSDYVKEIRPAVNHLNATLTYLHMILKSIGDLEERNQVFVSSVVLGIGYVDEFLSWDASQYGRITSLVYPQEHLWLPDLVVDNSVEKMVQVGYDGMKLTIYDDGKVIWRPNAVARTSCSIDVTYYPFDTQTCSIVLSTWTSTSEEINLRSDLLFGGRIQLDNYQDNGAWELVHTAVQDVSDNSLRNKISFDFTIKRRKTWYVLNLIIPVIALCMTASLVFGLPADAGEKVGMSITVLLAYAVYLTIISESMPRTSLQVSIMGVYLSVLLTATALAVVCTVFVLHLHHRDGGTAPGSRWRYFTIQLRPCVALHDLRGTNTTTTGEESVSSLSDGDRRSTAVNQDKGRGGRKYSLGRSIFSTNKVGVMSDNNNGRHPTTTDVIEKDQSRIGSKVSNNHVAKETTPTTTPQVTWRHVAETVDRLLFILFTSFTALSSTVFVCLLTFGSP